MFFQTTVEPGRLPRLSAIEHITTPIQRYFCLMGETLLFQTNDERLLTIAQQAFANNPQTSVSSTPPLVLRFVTHPITGTVGTAVLHAKPIYNSLGHLLYLTVGDQNTLIVDMQQGYAVCFLSPAMVEDGNFVRYTFVEAAAQLMLGLARGFAAVHAACVVKKGVGILLCAEAGTGKSTLTYACLRRGYQIVADDVVQIKLSQPELRVWGLPGKFHLLEDSIRFFPELAGIAAQTLVNGERKIELDVATLFPGAARSDVIPSLLICLQRCPSHPTTTLLPINAAEAEQNFPLIWSWEIGWKEEYEARLRAIFTRAAYRLTLAGSPDEAVDLLDRLVGRLGD